MIRQFVSAYLDYMFATLVEPWRLPDFILRSMGHRWHTMTSLLIVSLAGSVGSYILRDYFTSMFALELLVLLVFHLLFLGIWSFLFSGAIAIVTGYFSYSDLEIPSEKQRLFHISVQTFVPFLFFMPAALSTKNLEHPAILMVPVILLLTGWSIYILLMSLSRMYEITMKQASVIYLSSMGMVLLFPLLAIGFWVTMAGALFF